MPHSSPELIPYQDAGSDPNVGGGEGGDGIDRRLRQLEDRMARIETRLEYMPTKQDLESVKTDLESVKTNLESVKTMIAEKSEVNTKWMMGVMIAALATIGATFIKTFIG